MRLGIVVHDTEALEALRQAPEDLAAAIDAWQRRAAPLVARELVTEIRAQQQSFGRTGELAGKVRVQELGRGTFAVASEAPHWPYFVLGTSAHEIRPRNAQALTIPLRFGGIARLGMTRGGQAFTVAAVQGPLLPGAKRKTRTSGVAFAKVVRHPGTAPHDVLTPTGQRVEPVLGQMLDEALRAQLGARALRSITGGAA